MPKNRIRPYGYKIEGGKTAIDAREAEIIREIYGRYAAGLSYKRIAEELTATGVRYMPDKPEWNKNMVARILQNQSYLGTEKFPAILKSDLQQAAQRMAKPYTHTESRDVKALKPLLVCGVCGEPVRRRLKATGGERWYCPSDTEHVSVALTDETLLAGVETLWRRLAEHPRLAEAEQNPAKQIDLATIRMQNEIDLALRQPDADPAEIQRSILSLAARKYALARDGGDDCQEIRPTGEQWDSTQLKHMTARIRVEHTRVTALVLKNGRIIQPQNAAGEGERPHE